MKRVPWNSIHEIVFNMNNSKELLTWGVAIWKSPNSESWSENSFQWKAMFREAKLCVPLEWQIRGNMRAPIRDKIRARSFLMKSLLFMGWTLSSPHVLSSAVSVSFLNKANRSGKYLGSEAAYVISTVKGPISRKMLWAAAGGSAIVLPSELVGGRALSIMEFLQTQVLGWISWTGKRGLVPPFLPLAMAVWELSCSNLVSSDLRLRGVKWAGFRSHAYSDLVLLEDIGNTGYTYKPHQRSLERLAFFFCP